jgi:phosphoserine phosphatase
LLKGDKETRLKNATEAIDKIIAAKDNLHSFSDSLQDINMLKNIGFSNTYDN